MPASGSRWWHRRSAGGGGGRPDLAQAGGKQPDQIPAAIEKALAFVREKLEAYP